MRAPIVTTLALGTTLGICLLPGPALAKDRPVFDRRTGMVEVAPAALTSASARRARAEIARLAHRLGPARLEALLASKDPGTAQAALDAVALVEGNVRFLGAVSALVVGPDHERAGRAARVLGKILGPESPKSLNDWDVSPEDVARACRALLAESASVDRPTPVRLSALEAFAEAYAVCPADPGFARLLDDVMPEIRRAAVLAPQAARARGAEALTALASDPVPQVAAAATAVWCRQRLARASGAGAGGAAAGGPSAGHPVAERAILTRMRTLVLLETTPADDAVEMLACLALSLDAEDQQAVAALRERTGTPLGDRARELGARGKP